MYKTLLLLFLLVVSGVVGAQEEESPLTAEQMANARKGTLELDTIEVNATLSVKEEAALRIVRQALDEPRSLKRKDFDKWRCWLEAPVGTRLKHLHCARNGDLWALAPKPGTSGARGLSAQDLTPAAYGGYGEILVSDKPVNGAKLERILRSLEGDGANDHMFIDLVLKGEEPPRDVPSDEELDQFARAWSDVDELTAEGEDESSQIRAIERSGLTLDRYNRIAALVEEFPYIHDEVASRLQQKDG